MTATADIMGSPGATVYATAPLINGVATFTEVMTIPDGCRIVRKEDGVIVDWVSCPPMRSGDSLQIRFTVTGGAEFSRIATASQQATASMASTAQVAKHLTATMHGITTNRMVLDEISGTGYARRKDLYNPKLAVELVPSTAWWSNVRSNVSRRDWEKCKAAVRQRSGSRCEICGGKGRKWPVECHEIWEYDDDHKIQTLVDLIALCPACHEVKHIGRAERMGRLPLAKAHLKKVNDWNDSKARNYLVDVFAEWRERSQHEWELDVSFLSILDIKPVSLDREQGVVD